MIRHANEIIAEHKCVQVENESAKTLRYWHIHAITPSYLESTKNHFPKPVSFSCARHGLVDAFTGKPTKGCNFKFLDSASTYCDPFEIPNGVTFARGLAQPGQWFQRTTIPLSSYNEVIPCSFFFYLAWLTPMPQLYLTY